MLAHRASRGRVGARTAASSLLTLLALGSLLVSSCAGDDSAAAPTTTTTERPATTSTTEPDGRPAIRAAYLASDEAAIAAGTIPDPALPALSATHVGPMLEQRQGLYRSLQRDGRVIRYPANSQRRVTIELNGIKIDDGIARFEGCAVDDGETIEVATGRVVAGGVGTVQFEAAMQLVDGAWKLAERRTVGRWEGIAGCAA